MIKKDDKIEVLGARVHNLKNIDVEIPRNSFTIITGLSGSGKSSLAFDTIFAEGQRRYIETFSVYARNFLGNMERPDVDKITGLSPVISIEQKTTNKNPRSTVGTTTEIYDFLRLLYARAGEAYSYISGEKMVKYTEEQKHDALEKAGMPQIPVISVNANGMETNPGFTLTPGLITKAMQAVVYGDIFMRVLYATRPYEKEPGAANALHEKWKKRCIASLSTRAAGMIEFRRNIRGIVRDFDRLPRVTVKKPRVGIVGEILVKFSPLANNHIVELLEAEGAEAVVPDLMDFLLYCFYNNNFKADHLGGKRSTARLCNLGIALLEYFRKVARRELDSSEHFTPPSRIWELADMAKEYVSLGNQTGEGWFLTGEMLELLHSGVENIVCTQPFGCLPNHIVGKGVIKELRRTNPGANIIAVDYDPGASEVNQLNRIKLMLATAQKNLTAD